MRACKINHLLTGISCGLSGVEDRNLKQYLTWVNKPPGKQVAADGEAPKQAERKASVHGSSSRKRQGQSRMQGTRAAAKGAVTAAKASMTAAKMRGAVSDAAEGIAMRLRGSRITKIPLGTADGGSTGKRTRVSRSAVLHHKSEPFSKRFKVSTRGTATATQATQ